MPQNTALNATFVQPAQKKQDVEPNDGEGGEVGSEAAKDSEIESSSEAEATSSEYSGESGAEPEQGAAGVPEVPALAPVQVVVKGKQGPAAAGVETRR